MAFPTTYQAKEVLNKVLNTDEDALKVDIDNVTLTTEGGDVSIEVDLDNATDDVLVYGNDGGANQKLKTDSDGHLQVDVLTSPTVTISDGGSTISIDDGGGNISIDDGGNNISIDDGGGSLTVDDGGGSLTVDGTVTANLSATDNAVLDSIDSDTTAIKTAVEIIDNAISGNEMQVDIVSDGAGLATSANQTTTNNHLGNMFYDTALAVTPSDGSDLSGEPYFAVWVGTGGDLKVDMADGGAAVTLSNCASGQLIPIMVERIYATGTTASNIIVFK